MVYGLELTKDRKHSRNRSQEESTIVLPTSLKSVVYESVTRDPFL